MPTKLAVFTADNHLRPNTWSKHPELRGDSYVSFQAIIDYCVAERLPLFLLGDTFDATTPPADAVVFFCGQIDRMEAADLPVYFIKGNHDDSTTAWPAVHKHCIHLDQVREGLGPYHVYGLDFRPAGELKAALSAIPVNERIDILLTHQSWQEIQRVGHTDGSFADIPPRPDGRTMLLITGDYHIHGCYVAALPDGTPFTAFSPGSTSMQKLNEDPVKKFYVLTTDNGQGELVSVTLPARQFNGFDCRNEQDFELMLNELRTYMPPVDTQLPEQIQKPILRIKFNDRIPEAYSRIVAAIGDKFHLFDEPQHLTEDVAINVDATPEGAFDSLITAIGQLSTPGSEQYNGARRLLEAEDPKAELTAMYQEYLQNHARQKIEGNTTGVPAGTVG